MSRSALSLSLVIHAGVLAVAGWASYSATKHAGPGLSEVGVLFSSEDLGGLLTTEAFPVEPPAAVIVPPSAEPSFTPPAPVVEISPTPLPPSMDIAPPTIETASSIPREMPQIPRANKEKTAERRSPSRSGGKSAPGGAAMAAGSNGGNSGGASRGGGGGIGYVPPQFLMRYKPPYPDQARAQKLTGTVILLVSVDESGRVTQARLHHSCGHDMLDRAALAAVGSWRFIPANQAGRAVSATVEVPIRFTFSS